MTWRMALSLILVLAMSAVAVALRTPRSLEQADTVMAVGLLMLGAWIAGMLFNQIRLPRICGYLLFGVLVGPFAFELISQAQLPDLAFAGDLAVAVIALTAGGEIKLSWVRDMIGKLAAVIAVHVGIVLLVGIGGLMLGRSLIPFMMDRSALTALVIAILTTIVIIANSPAVVIAMISEYRAAGPLCQMTLAFTVLMDLVLIILFSTAMSLTKGMLDGEAALSGSFLLAIGAQLGGSILLGAAMGVAMAWYVHRIQARLVFFVIGSCLLFALLGKQHFAIAGNDAHLEPLLMALSAGVLMRNLWPDRTEPLFHTIEEMSLPVYCLFFAVAGAKIDLHAFAQLWLLAVVMSIVRTGTICLSVATGARIAGISGPWVSKLWFGMIPQAGVVLVLITLIGRSFGAYDWGRDLANLLIGMLIIHELLGPIGFRYALVSTGEVGKADQPDNSANQPAPTR